MILRVLLLLLLATPAAADELSAVAAAESASTAHERWCSDVAAARSTRSFEASAEVSAVLADVSRAYDREPVVWLLYWRGLLAACAEREERAIEDLQTFIATAEGEASLTTQLEDARRRLRRLQLGGAPKVQSAPPTLGLGIGLLAGGGVLGGFAGWQGAEFSRNQDSFRSSTLPWSERVATYAVPGEQAATASNALLGTSIGMAVGGGATLALTAALGEKAPGVAVVPSDRGWLLTWAGRW